MEKAFKKRFVILMLPTLIAFIIAFIIPFVLGIYLSFTKFTTVTDAQWIGLSNYIVAFRDKDFLASLLFTVKFVLVNAGICVVQKAPWNKYFPNSYIYAEPSGRNCAWLYLAANY